MRRQSRRLMNLLFWADFCQRPYVLESCFSRFARAVSLRNYSQVLPDDERKSLKCMPTNSAKQGKQSIKPNSFPNRMMLIDGTSILYRSYYKLLARLHHGTLENADGNGDWVLTIFTALSMLLDVLEFVPSHIAVYMICGFISALPHVRPLIFSTAHYPIAAHSLPFNAVFRHPCAYRYCLNATMGGYTGVEMDGLLQISLKMFELHRHPLTNKHTTGSCKYFRVVFDHDGFSFDQTTIMPFKENFMSKGLTFRHMLYPSYKGNRTPTPDTVVQGFQYLKASIKAMSIKVIQVPGVEADDVIGTLAVNSVSAGFKVRIVSPDKDFFQILSPSLRLIRIATRGSGMFSFGLEEFAERYGALNPCQFIDLIALAGDKSDNIPGIEGIGDVIALKLITKFGSVENLLQCLDQIEKERIRKVLTENAEQAILCKNLATLRCDLPSYMVPFKMPDLVFRKPEDNGEKFSSLLRAIGAYAEGSSADSIIRRSASLWKKLKNLP